MECTAGCLTRDILKHQSLSLWQHSKYLHCQHSYRFLCQLYAQVVGNFSKLHTENEKQYVHFRSDHISKFKILEYVISPNEINHEWP